MAVREPMGTSSLRVAWGADDTDPSLASIRLRMQLPIRELAGMGLQVAQFGAGVATDPRDFDVMVFSKTLSAANLKLAREARQHDCRVIYDLCDNLYESRPGPRRDRRVAMLEQFLQLADRVVFSTPALRRQVLALHPQLDARSLVIPDALEPLDAARVPRLIERWHLARLQRFLARHPGALHCVWFGKSQGNLAGLRHLQRAVRELEAFSSQRPVTLTVISNRWWRYRGVHRGWRIPHLYLPWSAATFGDALRAHAVAVIPVEHNGYTVGKSINRPATAIMAGLGVVADSIESYEELRPFVMLDCWQDGLRHYAAHAPAQDPRLAGAREYLQRHYGSGRIGWLWRAVLEERDAAVAA